VKRWLKGEPEPEQRLPHSTGSPDDPVAILLDGIEERPGRPMDPLMARSIYDEIVWLTDGGGVLFARQQTICDRVAAARARLRWGKRAGRCTIGKVAAVICHLTLAGWLVRVRKTCRQAVWKVGHAGAETRSAGAIDLLTENYSSRAEALQGVIKSEKISSLSTRETGRSLQEQQARTLATRVVREHQALLSCKNVQNGAGAWWKFLVTRLMWLRPTEQATEAARYAEAIDRLAAKRGRAWLSSDAVARVWPSGPITPLCA
jgi:hypothetical protein